MRVLRMGPGDEIAVVDGAGGWYHVLLEHVDRNQVLGRVLDRKENVGEPGYDLTVALGVLKNPNRFEVFLEKSAELGVGSVVPLLTSRTEKSRIKEARAEKILISATKQTKRSRLVNLEAPQTFEGFLKNSVFDTGLICHEGSAGVESIVEVFRNERPARRIVLLVGPEGGFSEEEVEQARQAGYKPVSLGPRRLRAETAALAAASAVMLLHH